MNDVKLNRFHSFIFILLAFSLPLSITLSETFYALAFLLWLIKIASQKKNSLCYTKLEIPILVLAIVYILTILFSSSPLESTRILKKLVKFGLIFLLANNLDSEAEKSRLINTWFLGVIIASVWTITEYFRGIPRPGGFFGPVIFGHFALMFLGVSLSLTGLKNYKRTSIISVLTFIVGIFALFLTCTRGAWIGFIAGLALFFIIKRRWLFLAASAVTLVLIVSVLFTYFPNSRPGKAVRSLSHPFNKQAPRVTSNLTRWYTWKACWQMFKKNPSFGVGPYQFKKELPNYLSEEVQADIFEHQINTHGHSIYLDYLATMGIMGLSALLFFLFVVFYLLTSKYKSCNRGFDKNLALGALIAFTSFCIAGLFDQTFHRSEILLNLCFILGLVL